jgi:monoamine oxidase
MSDVDLIIIGAGAAGLAAARAATENGLPYLLLEGSHRIGGRAYTEEMAPGIPFDLGCHWMHSASLNPFVPIADRLSFHYRKNGEWHPNAFTNGRWATAAENARISALGDANHAAMEKLAARGEDASVADLADHESYGAAFQSYWFTLYTSRDMDQVSAADVLAYEDTHENWPVREGYGALVAHWAADIPVSLNAAATHIRWSNQGVAVETPKGTVRGRKVLITISTNMLAAGRITFDPPLPDWKIEAAAALPLGVHNRIGIKLAHNPFGPDTPVSATIELQNDEPPMAMQLRPFDMDYVVGVTGGRFGQWLEDAGIDASVDHLTERLVAAFGSNIRKALTSRSIVTAWSGDPWTLGSYSGALPGNAHQRRELARPVDDILFFAGEATSPNFFSTCHGAYLSGIAAVKQMAGSRGKGGLIDLKESVRRGR